MDDAAAEPDSVQKRHYFVDEAGDPVLFNRRKKIVVGTGGCSTFFMLGREHNLKQPKYRYHPNQLYDRCVSRLFRDRLHKDDAYRVVFARRGTSDRTAALLKALETARANFRRKWGIEATAPIEVVPSVPTIDPCLQAADYFLWTLQRLFERQEERYWHFVWPKVSLVYDIDDVRNNEYGEFYSQRNPLNIDSLKKRTPGI